MNPSITRECPVCQELPVVQTRDGRTIGPCMCLRGYHPAPPDQAIDLAPHLSYSQPWLQRRRLPLPPAYLYGGAPR